LIELKKEGDKFIGKVNSKYVRSDGGASCELQSQIELNLVTPERIEGRAQSWPANTKIDWTKCSIAAEKEWKDFTWIPVK
jgi:hypothetical protein